MQSDRFRQLLDTPGPFASIYFEDSHDTHDAADQLELKWRGLREQLERQGVADSVTADIEQAVLELRPPIGRSGRAVIADERMAPTDGVAAVLRYAPTLH